MVNASSISAAGALKELSRGYADLMGPKRKGRKQRACTNMLQLPCSAMLL